MKNRVLKLCRSKYGLGKISSGLLLFGLVFLLTACAEEVVLEPRSATSCEVNFNGQAETGDLTGWGIIANGPDPWAVCSPGYFCTSWAWAQKSQLIDLVAEGFSTTELDQGPDISVSENFFNPFWTTPYSISYYLNVELRDALGTPIVSFASGTLEGIVVGANESISHTFSNYYDPLKPVRYVYWEDGGKETRGWAGYYGARLNGASLQVTSKNCPY